jgi:hypothetical protein
VNWRAIGCGALAALVFVGIGLLGMSMAFGGLKGCPDSLQWGDRSYLPDGPLLSAPGFPEGSPVEIGSTFIGLTTRQVWGPPGSAPSTKASDRPARIVLDCDDGTYQSFRYGKFPPPVPSG